MCVSENGDALPINASKTKLALHVLCKYRNIYDSYIIMYIIIIIFSYSAWEKKRTKEKSQSWKKSDAL